MYSPTLIEDSYIQYIGVDNNNLKMFFENATTTNLAQHKVFDLVGKRVRSVSIQCKNGHISDVIVIEINGKRVLDKIPLFQSCLLEVSRLGFEVLEPIDITIISEVTNSKLEVVVLFGVESFNS